MLKKAAIGVQKQLDLVKFIRKKRMLSVAYLASLSTSQRLLIHKMSALHLSDESTDGHSSSEHDNQTEKIPVDQAESIPVRMAYSKAARSKALLRVGQIYDAKRSKARLCVKDKEQAQVEP